MIRELLPVSVVDRIWAHVETPFKKGSRPVDQNRWRYNSNDPVAVALSCERAIAEGVNAFMYNSYAKGSYEDTCRKVYFEQTLKYGMNQLINIDGSQITSGPAYMAYLDYTVSCIDTLPNYEKFNGKPIITLFGKAGIEAAWLRAGEMKYPDICFIYYDCPYGQNLMDWIKVTTDPTLPQAAFCQKYANDKSALFVPCLFMGFNDTVMRLVNGKLLATSVWEPPLIPARVAPAEGPNAGTWAKCCENIRTYKPVGGAWPFAQIVTWNDQDEGTNVEFGIPKL